MNYLDSLFNLRGKRAFITGSSRGIGKAIAEVLGKAGAEVIIHGSRPSCKLDNTVSELKEKSIRCTGIASDISDSAGNRTLIKKLGVVDIIVLNASVQYKTGWEDITPSEFDKQVKVNWRSTLEFIQGFAPGMLERGWGRILTIGSVNQEKQHPDMVVYAATKSAVLNMVRNFARQFASRGVTVNNLAPGVIDTDRNKEAFLDRNYYEKILRAIPMNRIGQPLECVGAALLLCSEAGSYITGQNIYVDGGMSL